MQTQFVRRDFGLIFQATVVSFSAAYMSWTVSFLIAFQGFPVSMTGARYGIAFLWFRYILWWKLHFMVHWLPCSSNVVNILFCRHQSLHTSADAKGESWSMHPTMCQLTQACIKSRGNHSGDVFLGRCYCFPFFWHVWHNLKDFLSSRQERILTMCSTK